MSDTLIGTGGQDVIKGHKGDDVIFGLGGDDFLYGQDGNDSLYGGAGGDVLFGGKGDDLMSGGGGNDTFDDNGGNSTLLGGAGDDVFGIYRQSLLNDDHIIAKGGTGDDTFYFSSYNAGQHVRLDGGSGDDTFLLWGSKGLLHIDLGDGHDVIYAASRYADGDGPIMVRNFEAGDAGDDLAILGLPKGHPKYVDGLIHWNHTINPFADGHLRLVQHGANVELQVDPFGGGASWSVSIIFKDTIVADFTAANFDGYDPHAGDGPLAT